MIALWPTIRHHHDNLIELPIKLTPSHSTVPLITQRFPLNTCCLSKSQNDTWLQHYRDPLRTPSTYCNCTISVWENKFLPSFKYKIIIYVDTFISHKLKACRKARKHMQQGRRECIISFVIHYLLVRCLFPPMSALSRQGWSFIHYSHYSFTNKLPVLFMWLLLRKVSVTSWLLSAFH